MSDSDSSILYRNPTSTTILIDIPRSIELAQYPSHPSNLHSSSSLTHKLPLSRRILSSQPLLHPYPSLEPKSAKAKAAANLVPESIHDLLLQKYIEFALREVRDVVGTEHEGEWCFPRVVQEGVGKRGFGEEEGRARARKKMKMKCEKSGSKTSYEEESESKDEEKPLNLSNRKTTTEIGIPNLERNEKEEDAPIKPSTALSPPIPLSEVKTLHPKSEEGLFYINTTSTTQHIKIHNQKNRVYIPPQSTFLLGSIASILPEFTFSAPPSKFNIMLLDPPWPNRSARRSKTYSTTPDIRHLLSSLPLSIHLKENGVIAMWITNKSAFREMVLGEGGLFEEWGVQLVEEWVWVKVTRRGEPVSDLQGRWRRAWECLLVGRKMGEGEMDGRGDGEVKRRIIVGVPDLHSRKPCLRGLFEDLLINDVGGESEGGGKRKYEALEVFARHLTAGWWSWGDDVLKFQGEEWWVDVDGELDDNCERNSIGSPV